MPQKKPGPEDTRQEALARAACAGDADAFGQLFGMLYGRVHRTVSGMMGNEQEAHDVAQEAWIKAWRQRGRFNFQSAFSTWVHRIAVNTALDALRRRKRLGRRLVRLFRGDRGDSIPVDTVPAKGASPDRALRNRELGEQIEAAIASLPDEQRTALVLREYEGYSYAEIAELMNCKPGTVMSRLHLARTRLQARLSKDLK
jgi:RNA polymerase sigma-70 factor (ECF subfamily)